MGCSAPIWRAPPGYAGNAMSQAPCILSIAEHAGWAHVVCVGARGTLPIVVDRQRITLIDAGLPTQPYHHDSLNMTEEAANALIAQVRESIARHTLNALTRVVSELATTRTVVALAIRESPFPELPRTVALAWGTQLLYSADGMMYQQALCRASRELGLQLHIYPRGPEIAMAAQQLGLTPHALEQFIGHAGRPAGPPWQLEHRRAYAAGIVALAAHVGGVRIPLL